jgi:HNH endonuclease
MPKGVPGSRPLCSIPGCSNQHLSRGWCRKHYYTWHRHGDPLGKAPPRPRKPPTPCKVEDCPQPAVCRGWCGIHYQRWRRHADPLIGRSIQIGNDPICSVEGCNKPHISSGFCHMHYKRWRKHGDPLLGGLKESPGPCPVEGCGEPAWPSGLCPKHYQAQYRADPQHRRFAREKTAKWRAENPERQRENLARWRTIPKNQQLARERARAWRIANPKRRSEQTARRNALKWSGQATRIPMELLEAKLAYWGWRCWIAGPNCVGEPEQWDHVKPLSKGGAHLLANLRPACQPCNFGKRAQWPFPTARFASEG